MNEIINFSSLYENYQIVLGKPTIYAEKITHFSAGGLGACAYSDDISIGELAKCWQHEEYHIKCLQELTIDMVRDFLNAYGKSELHGDTKKRNAATVKICIRSILDFIIMRFTRHIL